MDWRPSTVAVQASTSVGLTTSTLPRWTIQAPPTSVAPTIVHTRTAWEDSERLTASSGTAQPHRQQLRALDAEVEAADRKRTHPGRVREFRESLRDGQPVHGAKHRGYEPFTSGEDGLSRFWWVALKCSVIGIVDRAYRVTQFTALEVRARLRAPSGADEEHARRLLTKAEETCLVTNPLKVRPHLEAIVEIEEP
jgi:hypothetical protein